MAGIGRVRIAYKDHEIWGLLGSFKNGPGKMIRNKYISGHILAPVTRETLKRSDIRVSFNRAGVAACQPTNDSDVYLNDSNAYIDQILFSSRDVSTNAGTCSSYILFCEKTRIAAAVHVSSAHLKDPLFHKDMLLYAYANLRQMAPKDPISAYISGMRLLSGPRFESLRYCMKKHNRINLLSALRELMGRGVRIRSIDIGDDYSQQVFSPATGKYKTFLSPFE
jgi:hypothetical protein